MSDTHAFIPCTLVAVLLHKLGHDGKSMPSIDLVTRLIHLSAALVDQHPAFAQAVYIADGGLTNWAFTVRELKAEGLGEHLTDEVPLDEVRLLGHKTYVEVQAALARGGMCRGRSLHWNNKHRRMGVALDLVNTIVRAMKQLYPSLESGKLNVAHVIKYTQAGDDYAEGLDEASAVAMGYALTVTLKYQPLIAALITPRKETL